MYVNSINCVILVVAPALIIFIYVVFIGLYCLMGGCGVVYLVRRLLSCFASRSARLLFQILAYVFIILALVGDGSAGVEIPGDSYDVSWLEYCLLVVKNVFSYSLFLSVIGVVYLLHSSYLLFLWFRGNRYPRSCFSPSELKTFLNRIQITEPQCRVKVSGAQLFPPSRRTLNKEFVPHLWTEFTESIDVVGARKNRIESADNISDVLEELLRKNKAFVVDIGTEICPEDSLSLKNTRHFVTRVLDTASTKFPTTSSAAMAIKIPTISQEEVSTDIPLKDGTIAPDQEILTRLNGPKLAAIVHRELDLPAFWYFMWKYEELLLVLSVILPPLGLFCQYLIESAAPRHNLDLNIKYSFVPQTDAPYELDKSVPEIDFSEPHKVMILMPSERFLVPRASLSRIITGDIDWRQNRLLRRTPSTESSPPILTPHTSNMAALLEHAEEYRRSRSSTSTETPSGTEERDSPPSYTAVFISETDGVTPPPHYSNLRNQEAATGKFF